MGMRRLNLTGQTFGNWVVIEPTSEPSKTGSYWLCKCVCGKEVAVNTSSLRRTVSTNCGCLHPRKRKSFGYSAALTVFNNYKLSAYNREYPFEITFQEFIEFTKQPCYYCGVINFSIKRGRMGSGDFAYNGLDRVDNNQGYTLQNIVACCGDCNHAKSDMTQAQYINQCIRVTKQHLKRVTHGNG